MEINSKIRSCLHSTCLSFVTVFLVSTAAIPYSPIEPTTVQAKEKVHDWKSGKLTDIDQRDASRLVEGTSHERIYWTYKVDDGTFIWKLQRDTRRRDKPLEVTINTMVDFAVEGQDGYLKDEHGEAHKLSVQTKTLK